MRRLAESATSRTMLVVRSAFMVVSCAVADVIQPRYEGSSGMSASRLTKGLSAS